MKEKKKKKEKRKRRKNKKGKRRKRRKKQKKTRTESNSPGLSGSQQDAVLGELEDRDVGEKADGVPGCARDGQVGRHALHEGLGFHQQAGCLTCNTVPKPSSDNNANRLKTSPPSPTPHPPN